MKGVASDQLLMIGSLVFAVLITLAVISACKSPDRTNTNLENIKTRFQDLETSTELSQEVFLAPNQYIAYFSKEKGYVLHETKKPWDENSLLRKNGWSNALVLVEKPLTCQGNCVCIMELEDKFSAVLPAAESDVSSVVEESEAKLNGDSVTKAMITKDADAECITVSFEPVKKQLFARENSVIDFILSDFSVYNQNGVLVAIPEEGSDSITLFLHKDIQTKEVNICKDKTACLENLKNLEAVSS